MDERQVNYMISRPTRRRDKYPKGTIALQVPVKKEVVCVRKSVRDGSS